MKELKLMCIAILSVLFADPANSQVSFGTPEKINADWLFSLSDPENAFRGDFDDEGWQPVDLPHDWSVEGRLSPALASCMGYLPGGIGWYRKVLDIPAERSGDKVFLHFEGVYNRSEVFVNGHSLGSRPNGYVSFMYDATPYIDFGGENVVAVRVDHSRSADSRWYTGSGIYRNVWLVYSDPVHIGQWGVYAYPSLATAARGVLETEITIENSTSERASVEVVNELLTADGRMVGRNSERLELDAGATGVADDKIAIAKPSLWSLESPSLYTLRTTLYKDGTRIDSSETTTGFRTFTFDPDTGFALNGRSMKLKGVCLHHDAGVLGSAVAPVVWRNRILALKEIGCNAIRTSHNPQSPDFYALCDELGMLVLNEMYDEWEYPKRKWIEGWNVGTPGFEGSYDFFEEWGERDLADFVLRDRNHPSIFAWSIGNEVDYPNDPYSHPVLDGGSDTGFTQPMFGGYKPDAPDARRLGAIASKLAAVVRKYDGSRPVTAGLAGVAMSNQTEYPGTLDIAGYNYTENMYDSDHAKYPERVIYGSENRHEPKNWRAVVERDFVMGQFLWTGIDYLGESGRWPSRGFYSGLLDFGGFVKPRGYFRQSLWSDKPMVYMGTYPTPGANSASRMQDVWSQLQAGKQQGDYVEKVPSMDAWPVWNYSDGDMIRVVCYTNAPRAKLLLDGKQVGETKPYEMESGIIHWDIPYRPGKLEAIGVDDDGGEISRYAIHTSGRPCAIKVLSVDKTIDRNMGVGVIMLQVVDEEGLPVMLSDDEIACTIEGPVRLLGLEASNNSDMGDYTDNLQRAFHGRLVAYIEAVGESGRATVSFSANWLKGTELTIDIE